MSLHPDPWGPLRRDLRVLAEGIPVPLPEKIGRYAVLTEISRTGSSVVYAARDPGLGRKVALKVLREEQAVPDFMRRFHREGAIAASLRHPNIITIYDVGLWQGPGGRELPYIAMDYLEGGTLAERRCSPGEAARLMATIADAVEHAHRGGVIHRDLKPANVLLDTGGKAVVSDFGLAKSASLNSSLTQQGTLLGTPQYMAPEQVLGEPEGKVDARTDVYGLGAILYELLGGVPPFSDRSTAALFEKILHAEPQPLSALAPALPRDLEAIALKALEKDPARRYPSADEFARDLRRHLAGEPVRARRPSPAARLFRKALNGKVLALLVAALLVAGAGLAASLRKAGRAREDLSRALGWEAEGETLKARDAFRAVLDARPDSAEARTGFERTDLELRSRTTVSGPAAAFVAWAELGTSGSGAGLSATAGDAQQPCLALDALGHPVVAWRDLSDPSDDIFLRRWNGKGWIELAGSANGGGVSNSLGQSRFPSLAIDPAGNPVVAWDDQRDEDREILVRRWDGSAWTALGIAPVTPARGVRGAPSLALDPAGNPVLAWQEEVQGRFEIYVRRWDGRTWAEIGGSATGRGLGGAGRASALPAAAVDREGHVTVAWMAEGATTCDVEVRRWDGAAWEDLGSRGLGAQIASKALEQYRPSLALDASGHAWIVWIGGQVFLKRWNGASWEELGGSAGGEGVSRSPGAHRSVSVAVDSRGRPAVAWGDNGSGVSKVYLRFWDGASWVELAGSATGTGISRTWSNSWAPIVRMDPRGNPVVAWVDGETGRNQIRVRHFNEGPPMSLRQLRRNGQAPLPRGTVVRDSGVAFSAVMTSPVAGTTLRLEVEVQSAEAPFSGRPSASSGPVGAGSPAVVTLEGLAPGRKRWQARTADALGMVSPWVSFGGPDGGADFEIGAAR